jgi:hypothetical protein
MNYLRIVEAALAATVCYFLAGGLIFTRPFMRKEFGKYPAVYRSEQTMRSVMPFGMLGMLVSMLVLAVLYAMIHPAGGSIVSGFEFGALIGVYALGSFVLHNHVNLNIGSRLTVYQGVAYFLEWIIVGLVVSLVYRGHP